MGFYFALYQILETIDRLTAEAKSLAGRTLRLGPKDARANRELLERAADQLKETRKLFSDKAPVSKVALRKAALLQQLVELAHRRFLFLAGALSSIGMDDEEARKALWHSLERAQKNFRQLVALLREYSGLSVALVLDVVEEKPKQVSDLFKRDLAFQNEIVRNLEKAIEIYGEEMGLVDALSALRKEFLETRKQSKWQAQQAEKRGKIAEEHQEAFS